MFCGRKPSSELLPFLPVESSQDDTRSTVLVNDSKRDSGSSFTGGSIAGANVFFVIWIEVKLFCSATFSREQWGTYLLCFRLEQWAVPAKARWSPGALLTHSWGSRSSRFGNNRWFHCQGVLDVQCKNNGCDLTEVNLKQKEKRKSRKEKHKSRNKSFGFHFTLIKSPFTKCLTPFLLDKDRLHVGQRDVSLLCCPPRCSVHDKSEVLMCVLRVSRQEILDT